MIDSSEIDLGGIDSNLIDLAWSIHLWSIML